MHAPGSKFLLDLESVFELYGVDTLTAGGFNVGWDVIGEEALFGLAVSMINGLLKDLGRRLHGAYFV
ncbi:MAG: hypothetical protein WKF37_09635 [Bryobacteraceae bacterium]